MYASVVCPHICTSVVSSRDMFMCSVQDPKTTAFEEKVYKYYIEHVSTTHMHARTHTHTHTHTHTQLPIISETEFLDDGTVLTYLLASVGSVEKSALHASVAYNWSCCCNIQIYNTIS